MRPELEGRSRRGRLGETLAAWSLRLRGWTLLGRNIRVAGVEVDLLARKGSVDALVEVKTRRGPAHRVPSPDRLVGTLQGRRLRRAAVAWSARHPARQVRVDLVEVRWGPGLPRVHHHPDILAESSPC